jgi:hypothetical protein
MRFIYLSLLAIIGSFLQPARAEQDSGSKLAIPSLGWVFDNQARAVRPIVGTLGAALLGRPLDAGFPIASASISTQRGFALAVSAEDHRVRLVELRGAAPIVKILEGIESSPDRMILSPLGTAAMLYYVEAARVQIITGLPDMPLVSRDISTGALGGVATELAISDDGNRSLLVLGDGGPLWMLDREAGSYLVPTPGSNSVIAFRPGGHDALAVTRVGELYLIGSGASVSNYGAVMGEGVGNPVGVQISRDGTHAYIAYSNGSIAEVDSTTGTVRTVSCGCRATGFDAVNSSTFLINEPSTAPLLLVNVSDGGPRVWFVPPDRTNSMIERGEQ